MTLYDIKSEINPDADEIESRSDGGSEEYDEYATYDDDGAHGAPSGGVGPTESSRLETAAMSPIQPSIQAQFDQLLGRADDMGLLIGEGRTENEASDGEPWTVVPWSMAALTARSAWPCGRKRRAPVGVGMRSG